MQTLTKYYSSTPNANARSSKFKQNSYTLNRESLIVAYCIISESELILGYPEYNSDMYINDKTKFESILYSLGLDTSLAYTRQDNLWHRNRLNKVVLCSRYLGEERQDKEWIASGYASQEAIDKASKNKILEDLYRTRNLTKDTQAVLESRDYYTVIDESVWE